MRYRRMLGRTVALASVAAVATSIALSRSSELLIVTIVATAMIWGALPQAIDAWFGASEPGNRRGEADTGTFTIAVHLRGQAGALSRLTVDAALAAAPTVVIATDAGAIERLGPVACPVVLADTIEQGISEVAAMIDTDAVMVLSAGSFIDATAVADAAGLISGTTGWVVGRSRVFNRDGFSPLVRGKLSRRLRASARAAGLQLWEPNATLLSARLLRDHPLPAGRPWGWLLRQLQGVGYRGEQCDVTFSMTAEPVEARGYWPASALRRRRAVAELADALVATRGRARLLAAGLLLRELDGVVLTVWLLCPWLLTRADVPAFRCPLWVLAMLVAVPALLRWMAQRTLHAQRLHPLEDMLAMAFDAPSSVLAVPTMFSRRVRPSHRLRLPSQPLVVAGVVFAAFTVFPLLTSGPTAQRSSAVGLALTELGLLWLMAMRVIFQRNWARSIYRIRTSLTATVDGCSSTVIDASPSGIAVAGLVEPMPVGSHVAIELALDDGSTLVAQGTVEEWTNRRGRSVAGLSIRLEPVDRPSWVRQLSRSAAHTTGERRLAEQDVHPSQPALTAGRRWSRRLLVAAILIVSVGALAVATSTMLGYRPLIIRSASMEPAIDTGDVVLVEEVEVRQLVVGDVATIPDPAEVDASLTHRVRAIAVAGDTVTLTTRGDANEIEETFTLPADALVGRVVTRVAAVGTLIAWAGNGMVRLSAFTVGLVIVGLVMWRERASDRRRAARLRHAPAMSPPE